MRIRYLRMSLGIFLTAGLIIQCSKDNGQNPQVFDPTTLITVVSGFDYGLNTFSTHALVADPSGHSAVLELYNGEMQVIPNTDSWQVATNSPLYNVSLSQALEQCSRYSYIYNRLSGWNGIMTWQQGMDILLNVGYQYTNNYCLTLI